MGQPAKGTKEWTGVASGPDHVLSSNLIAFSYDHYELGIWRAAIALTDFQPTFQGKSHTMKMDSEHHDTHRWDVKHQEILMWLYRKTSTKNSKCDIKDYPATQYCRVGHHVYRAWPQCDFNPQYFHIKALNLADGYFKPNHINNRTTYISALTSDRNSQSNRGSPQPCIAVTSCHHSPLMRVRTQML